MGSCDVFQSFFLSFMHTIFCCVDKKYKQFNEVQGNIFFALVAFSPDFSVEFNIWQEDWQKEKRDFLQSLSRISTLPKTNISDSSTGATRPGQIASMTSSPQVSSGLPSMELVPLANKPVLEKKTSVYAEVVKNLNSARERGLPFKVCFVTCYSKVLFFSL